VWELEAAAIQARPESEHQILVENRGFGSMRLAICSGAAISPQLVRQWLDWGVALHQEYGLTECGGIATINLGDVFSPGTAGKPVSGTELAIAADGEILIRGPIVFSGYLNRPDDTAKALDAKGWLHTGDIGELLPDGSLRVFDRKADLIVMADGQVVVSSMIETQFTVSPYIRHAILVGEGRDSLGALIELDSHQVMRWAHGRDLVVGETHRSLAEAPSVRSLIAVEVRNLNSLLEDRGLQPVQGFEILPEELDLQDLRIATVTRKIRRNAIIELYSDLVDRLYA
jgi:long-chain acyl-CoA synthetase